MSFSSAQTGTAPRAVLWADVRDSIRGVPRDYTTGRIGRAVVLLAIPMVLEMSMQSLFAVVDVFFVGRLGPEAVAILGLSDSLLALVFAVAIGLCMGTTAMVARRIGEGAPDQAAAVAVQAIATGVAVSIVLGVAGVAWAPDLLQMLGASPELASRGRLFTSIMLGGNVTVMLPFLIKRPQFSWTLIRGESNVQGGGGNGSIEERAGEGVGGDGGSPEGDRSARRRRGR